MIPGTLAFFARRLMRQLTELATQTLYSEQFDMEAVVSRLSRKQNGVHLLRAYVAIQTAGQLKEPLCDADIDRALETVRSSEEKFESRLFQELLEVHHQMAEYYWKTTQIEILRGKLAHKRDAESFDGTIYSYQFSNKGPVSRDVREKYGPICKKIDELNRELVIAELDALKKQDEKEYIRYKDEVEARALSDEIEANELETSRIDNLEWKSVLDTKLSNLLNSA